MSMITLTVTTGVLSQAKIDGPGACQLAIRGASKDIRQAIKPASRKQLVTILLADRIRLVVGDPGAIWRSHNLHTHEQFDLLFALLALKPDAAMPFDCSILDTPTTSGEDPLQI
jgi:hypothetical protein